MSCLNNGRRTAEYSVSAWHLGATFRSGRNQFIIDSLIESEGWVTRLLMIPNLVYENLGIFQTLATILDHDTLHNADIPMRNRRKRQLDSDTKDSNETSSS
jgi:hypothetical protein